MTEKKDNKIKIVIVSGLTPEGHYTNTLLEGYKVNNKYEVIVYTDNNSRKSIFEVKKVWKKNAKFFVDILWQLIKDRPDICHYQHEINMFGPKVTAIIFPLLIFLTKLIGIKVVCTVHATVSEKQINDEFLETFSYKVSHLNTFTTKAFFYILYSMINIFSNKIIVHTEYARSVLLEYPFANKNNIAVIAHPFPNYTYKNNQNDQKITNLLYFGYFAKRKGILNILRGFNEFVKKHPMSKVKLYLGGGVIPGQEIVIEQIQEFIQKHNLKTKVIYLGFQAKLNDIYKLANIVLLPSSLVVSSSGPMCHAISRSKIALVSDNPYIKEELKDKVNCLIVKDSDWEAAISTILKDSHLRETITNNLPLIQHKRSSANIFRLHEDLYLKSL